MTYQLRPSQTESIDRLEDLRSIAETLTRLTTFSDDEAIEAIEGLYQIWSREDMKSASHLIKDENPSAFKRLGRLVVTYGELKAKCIN